MTLCHQCSRPISLDEQGMSRKLISRGTDKLYCYDCLGAMFRISREKLEEMAESFRRSGCTLFL